MTAKRIVIVMTLLLIGSLVYWASNCNGTNGCELGDLLGTWFNSDYNGLSFPKCGKVETTESYEGFVIDWYVYDTDDWAEYGATFEIDEKWNDDECATLYHVTSVDTSDNLPNTMYGLLKVDVEYTTLEMQYSEVSYPSDFNIDNPWYAIYYWD